MAKISHFPKNILSRYSSVSNSPFFVPLILFAVCLFSYGLLIPWLHLYYDDWLLAWTWDNYGSAGLTKYFATNRPIWGLLFQVTLPVLGANALAYQVFGFAVRWLSSLACWWLFTLLFPRRRDLAFWAAVLFLVYPGFALQSIALTYSHIFLVFIFFLLSLCFQLCALRNPGRAWGYHLLALFFSLANLLSMEYFFTLELARPVILWTSVSGQAAGVAKRTRQVLVQWLPYLVAWLGVLIWRSFFFEYQTHNYQLSLLSALRDQPTNAILALTKTALTDLFETSFGAWVPAVQRFTSLNWLQRNSLITLVIAAVVFLIAFGSGLLLQKPAAAKTKKWTLQFLMVGMLLMLAAGVPFWVTGLEVEPQLLHSRLTIPFLLGVVFLLTGLCEAFSNPRLRAALLALAVAAASGSQFQYANDLRIDWENTRTMMWQIAWRIPRLAKGTTLLVSDIPVYFYNTQELANVAALSTQLDYLYPTKKEDFTLPYYFLFAREADRYLPGGLKENTPIRENNVTSEFFGNTNQVLAATYSPRNCFRLLNPIIDSYDATLSEPIRKAAQLSNWEWISTNNIDSTPPANLFGKQPMRNWCYYFEKSELARQNGDWETSVRLGDEALEAGLRPRDKMEWMGLIEAYARTGQWSRAADISRDFPPEKQPMLCRLWSQMVKETPNSEARAQALQTVQQGNNCQLAADKQE